MPTESPQPESTHTQGTHAEGTLLDGRFDPQITVPLPTTDTSAASPNTIAETILPILLRQSPAGEVPGFDLLAELGRGGMGVVYKARQHGLDRIVALKMLLHGAHAAQEQLDRFRAEAEAIARLRHPNIVEVYAYGETGDGLPYFALEFCEGGTLATRCSQPLPLREAAELVALMARAVHAAHSAGIIHRDLKPANVLLTATGTPKITDFGLAKGLSDTQGRTQTGAIMGTPAYMAPEQAAGRTAEIGPRVDVYALGAILYHLLTGQQPFDSSRSGLEVLHAVQRDEPLRPRRLRKDLPPDLEAVVLRCLEKSPADRYPSAAELADDLERWLRGEPVSAHAHSVFYRVRKKLIRRRRWIAAGMALMLLMLASWVVLADRGHALPAGDWLRKRIDRLELSFQRRAPSIEELRENAATQRRELANHALHTATRKGDWISGNMKAGTPYDQPDSWGIVQSIACLLSTPEVSNEELRPLVTILHTTLFEKNDFIPPFHPKHGWPHFRLNHPSLEGCGWALTAIPAALARPGLCTPDERELLLKRLDAIQATFDMCQVRDPHTNGDTGRWNLVAQITGPADGNIFTAVLVYQGLIELTRANLPWRGDIARRESLFRATYAAIVEQFNGKGWVTTNGRSQSDVNDGLTLQLFALLLRAERFGLAELPPAIAEQIPRALADCATRQLDHPINTAVFEVETVTPAGDKLILHRPVRFLWHPWAIECGAHWLTRLKRAGKPHEEIVAARRLLGHLVITLGSHAETEMKSGYSYVLYEGLLGLNTLEQIEN